MIFKNWMHVTSHGSSGAKKGLFADISRRDFAVTLNIYPFYDPAFLPLDICKQKMKT